MGATIICIPKIVGGPLVAGLSQFQLLLEQPQGLLRGPFVLDKLPGIYAIGGRDFQARHFGKTSLQLVRVVAEEGADQSVALPGRPEETGCPYVRSARTARR